VDLIVRGAVQTLLNDAVGKQVFHHWANKWRDRAPDLNGLLTPEFADILPHICTFSEDREIFRTEYWGERFRRYFGPKPDDFLSCMPQTERDRRRAHMLDAFANPSILEVASTVIFTGRQTAISEFYFPLSTHHVNGHNRCFLCALSHSLIEAGQADDYDVQSWGGQIFHQHFPE
tara:strand:- start:30 stop:554 length:525 start_codon:yes stop_codon:yes gene_type:complete